MKKKTSAAKKMLKGLSRGTDASEMLKGINKGAAAKAMLRGSDEYAKQLKKRVG